MSFTTCHIHFTRRNGNTIYATGSLFNQLKLPSTKKSVKIAFGKKKVSTPIRRIRRPGNHLFLPPSVRSVIRVPRRGVSYILNQSGELKIGPLIGIMCSSAYRTAQQPFGKRSELIKSFLRHGNDKAFYFAFRPRDIDWKNETVIAWFPNEAGQWERKTVPLPDVVYNRLPSRSAEKSQAILGLKERFLRRNIPIFNWSFFDKWDVYDLLKNDPDASVHVPESIINPSPEQLRQMLEKHSFIYLKPTGGSLGIGIFRITYHKNSGYFVRYRRGSRNVLLRFNQFSGLMRLLNNLTRGRMKNYVAQQGIRLLELDGSPIDFRFHMNKNGRNEWVVGGIGAKRAGRGSITTHVRTGGQVIPPEKALTRILGEEKARAALQEAKQTAIKLARAIERNYRYRIGELGFDLGIDKDGKIWMFEANSKPGRSIFKHPALKEQGRETLSLIFEHCLYLAKFRNPKGEEST
jgi:hypothetical protein